LTALAAPLRSNPRAAVGHAADRLAAVAFAVLIVASPMAARFDLMERPNPDVAAAYTDLLLPWVYVGILAILGLWLVGIVCRPRRLDPGPTFVWLPSVGLVVAAVASVPLSIDPTLAAFNVIRLLIVIGLAAWVVNEVVDLDRLAIPLLLMVGTEAVIAIGQAVQQRSLGLRWLQEVRTGVSIIGASVIGAADGSRWLRAFGLTPHANILGGVLMTGLLLLPTVVGGGRRAMLVGATVFGLGVAALFLTFSRGAWIGFAVGLAVALLMLAVARDRAGVRRWAGAAVIAVVVSAALAIPFMAQVAARTTLAGPVPTEIRSIDERVELMRVTLDVIAAHPLVGTGLGTLPLVLPGSATDYEYAFQPAHLVALDAAAETGVVGLAAYLALVVSPWVALLRVRPRWTGWLAGTSAALAAITVVGLFDFYTWAPTAGRTWAWIVLGLWVVAYRRATADADPGPSSPT
jgi:putative inorganic carbon (HCO3(-)) transporter